MRFQVSRARGYYAEAGKGKRGGELTTKAKRLLRKGKR